MVILKLTNAKLMIHKINRYLTACILNLRMNSLITGKNKYRPNNSQIYHIRLSPKNQLITTSGVFPKTVNLMMHVTITQNTKGIRILENLLLKKLFNSYSLLRSNAPLNIKNKGTQIPPKSLQK